MLETIYLKVLLITFAHHWLRTELISGREEKGKGNVVASERLGGLLRYCHRRAA